MKLLVTYFSLVTSVLAVATTANAGISFSSTSSGTAWNGTPVYTSVPNASFSSITVGQGTATITGVYGVMGEVFTPTSAFTLGGFNLLMQVTSAGTYEFHLYDLGPAGTVPVGASGSYTPGTDLFSGLSVSLGVNSGGVQGEFSLSGPDQVSLLANRQYALEVWTPAANTASGFVWYRLPSATPADPGGQMFSAGDSAGLRQTLNLNGQAGGAPRTAGLALYAAVVPEPSAMALISLGGLALIARRRK